MRTLQLCILAATLTACSGVRWTPPTASAPESLAAAAAASAVAPKAAAVAPAPSSSKAQEEAVIAAALQQVQTAKVDYRISGADLLQVTVLGEKDFDRTARVGQNGNISYPLVGEVKVGGLSTSEAERAIADGLKDYLVKPQVTVFIKEYGNKKVFVFGQVFKPGAVEIPTETKMTVLEAVSQAGGFTRIAAPDRTRVIRSVNGKSESYEIEVSAITKRGEKQKDISLEPNDIVFVPESFF